MYGRILDYITWSKKITVKQKNADRIAVFYLLIKLVVFVDRLLAYSRHSSLSDSQAPEKKVYKLGWRSKIVSLQKHYYHLRKHVLIKLANSPKLNCKREQGMNSILRKKLSYHQLQLVEVEAVSKLLYSCEAFQDSRGCSTSLLADLSNKCSLQIGSSLGRKYTEILSTFSLHFSEAFIFTSSPTWTLPSPPLWGKWGEMFTDAKILVLKMQRNKKWQHFRRFRDSLQIHVSIREWAHVNIHSLY